MKISEFYKNKKIFISYKQLTAAQIPKGFHKNILKTVYSYNEEKDEQKKRLLFKKVKALTLVGITSKMIINAYMAHVRHGEKNDFTMFSGDIKREAIRQNNENAIKINSLFDAVLAENNPSKIDNIVNSLFGFAEQRIGKIIYYTNQRLSSLVIPMDDTDIHEISSYSDFVVLTSSPYSIRHFLRWTPENESRKPQKKVGGLPTNKKPERSVNFSALTYIFGFSLLLTLVFLIFASAN